MRRIIQFTLLLLFVLMGSSALAAQTRVRTGAMAPLAEDDPRRVRAQEMVAPILAGNLAAAEAYLKEHATPGFGASEAFVPLTALADLADGYSIERIDASPAFPNNVLVRMTRGENVRIVVVVIEPGAPFRIVGLENPQVRMRQRTDDAPRR